MLKLKPSSTYPTSEATGVKSPRIPISSKMNFPLMPGESQSWLGMEKQIKRLGQVPLWSEAP